MLTVNKLPASNLSVINTVERTPRTKPIQRSEVLGPLRALTDDTRLQILELLALNEQMSAQEILAQLEVEQSTVARHLQQLVAAGFVTEQRTGDTDKLYRLCAERVDELFVRLRQLLSTANATAILSDARRALPEVLHRFVDSDGLVTLWPRRERDREAVLGYLVSKFRRNHLYNEAEVNEVLSLWHTFQDPANMRRQLVDYGYLGRTSSGDRYWRER
jgi:DNA-binding MarR family transcriptional regulator